METQRFTTFIYATATAYNNNVVIIKVSQCTITYGCKSLLSFHINLHIVIEKFANEFMPRKM